MKKSLLILAGFLLCVAQSYSQASFTTGAIEVSVNQYGRIRLFSPDGIKQLERASILVGTAPDAVFDYTNDAEALEATTLVSSPTSSDFELYGSFDNTYSSLPPDVIVKLNAYGWNNEGYTIVKFNVKNDETAAINASVGLDIIPYLNEEYGFDTVSYLDAEGVIRFHRGTQQNVGMKLLSASLSSLYSFEWYDGYSVDTSLWSWMNKGSLQPQYESNTADGPVTVTAQAPVTIAPGESFNVFYALAIGADQTTMLANISAAVSKYQILTTDVEDFTQAANKFNLGNYPNPCKSATTITYQLPTEGFASLKLYNAYGKEVSTLVNSKQSGGLHTIQYNAGDLASGVYYYTLRFNDQVQTNKLLLSK